MDVGTAEVHDVILHAGDGATTDVTMTGDVTAGATIGSATRDGGPATIGGGTTTGAIDGATTVGVIDVTVAIDSRGEFRIGIAGGKLSQLRDINAGPT
jgi:hypothetical protein